MVTDASTGFSSGRAEHKAGIRSSNEGLGNADSTGGGGIGLLVRFEWVCCSRLILSPDCSRGVI